MSEPTGPTGPTRPMPAAPPPAAQPGPPQPGSPPPGPAQAGPAQTGPLHPGQPGAPVAAQPGRPPKGPNLFRQATSTTGGTIALIVAAGLALLLVLGVAGVGAVAVARAVVGHHDRTDRMEQMRDQGEGGLPPGPQRRLDRGNGAAPGGGMGSMMGGLGALGNVQHGEFTAQDAAGTSVVMTVQRGTVTAASTSSVSVKSADGFTATYAVDGSTRGGATSWTKGDSVLVVAQKAGARAVLIRAARTP
ncbi:hypothetical protein ABEG17_05845 [Pedococcus sp. KACC 23699]|uniref:DUF5666 domain-containing protein n=1 Tax=Pedococcus sp. KACC 23699 TaxID=3149228 RepID=A0AAU7JX95_9MICO